MSAFTFTLQDALSALQRTTGHAPKLNGHGYICHCPAHEDETPSLSISEGDNGKVLLYCHAGCSYEAITAALGLDRKPATQAPKNGARRLVATYSYHAADGVEVRQKLRYDPKDFRIRHQGASGEWVYKAGPGPAVLYRLPELQAAITKGETVFVCEGEKDADRLAALGFVTTCNIEGAASPGQKTKWRKEYTAQLAGAARVILLPDNDEPGRAHMAAVAAALKGDVRIVDLPGLPAKGDVSDWLNQDHTAEELAALADSAKNENLRLIRSPGEEAKWVEVPPALAKKIPISDQPYDLPVKAVARLVFNDSLLKHNKTAEILFKTEFKKRLFYDPIRLEWLEYRPERGVFELRPQLAIEKAVYRAIGQWENTGGKGFDAAYVAGVTKCLLYESVQQAEAVKGKICFTNGVLDLATRELLPHSPDHHFTTSLPFDWTPDAPEPTLVTDWLMEVLEGHADRVQLIRAFINAVVVGRPDLQRFLEIVGYGGTGKGTLIRLITALVGSEAVHSTQLKQLEENRFESANIFGKKLVVISDAEKYHGDVSILKNITGEDPIRFEQKHKQGGDNFTYGGMVLISANQHTESTDYSSGIQRRRISVPFNVVCPINRKRDLAAEFDPLLPAVLKWVLDMPQHEVTAYLRSTSVHAASLRDARIEALAATNPMVAWMLDNVHFAENVESQIGVKNRLTISEGHNDGDSTTMTHVEYENENVWLYPNYCQWCDQNGKKPVAKNQFSTIAIDAARNMLAKTYVRYERRNAGRYVIGMALHTAPTSFTTTQCHDNPCQPVTTSDNRVTTQVIDCAELDNLTAISEVTEFLNSECEAESIAMHSAETAVANSGKYEDVCNVGRHGRHVQHNQQDRLSLGRHWVVTGSSLPPSTSDLALKIQRVIRNFGTAGVTEDELRRQCRAEKDGSFVATLHELGRRGDVLKAGGRWTAVDAGEWEAVR